VRGIKEDGVTEWQVYRPARPLVDPDTRKPLAYEALFLGSAQVVRKGDPATIRIVANAEEIGEGDRLVPAEAAQTVNFAPRPPDRDVSARSSRSTAESPRSARTASWRSTWGACTDWKWDTC
jgi:hypothetical protein